jgi:hypothetical protein
MLESNEQPTCASALPHICLFAPCRILSVCKDTLFPPKQSKAQTQQRAVQIAFLIALFRGLRYNNIKLGLDAQTKPPGSGPAGETRAWRHVLTGLFLTGLITIILAGENVNQQKKK